MSLVTLHDGRQVDSYSDEWKLETLAAYVWTIKPTARRQLWVAELTKGKPEFAEALRVRMVAIRAHNHATTSPEPTMATKPNPIQEAVNPGARLKRQEDDAGMPQPQVVDNSTKSSVMSQSDFGRPSEAGKARANRPSEAELRAKMKK